METNLAIDLGVLYDLEELEEVQMGETHEPDGTVEERKQSSHNSEISAGLWHSKVYFGLDEIDPFGFKLRLS